MMAFIVATLMLGTIAPQAPVNTRAAALDDFSRRLQAYFQLRAEAARNLEPLSTTPSAADLKRRQQALAAAVRAARDLAKPGDLIPLAVQRQIREAVAADFRRREPAAKQAALQEVPSGPLPGINRTYPEDAALPPVPPLLLANLPPLPDNLQYRFFGRHIVILDGDIEIVVDYVQNAVPR